MEFESELTPTIETVDFRASPVRFYCQNPLVLRRARGALIKEPDTIRWLDSIPAGSTLWDVGANIGVYSFYAAVVRGCRVVAFEPAAANYLCLNRSIELNNLQDSITAYCLAVAGSSSLDVLYLPRTGAGESLSNFAAPIDFQGNPFVPKFKQGAIGMSLDQIEQSGLPHPDFIKIDVDGLEHEIVRGSPKFFETDRLKSALIELDIARPELVADVVRMMNASGLTFVNEEASPGNRQVINAIFDRR